MRTSSVLVATVCVMVSGAALAQTNEVRFVPRQVVAVPAVTYDQLWMSRLTIDAPTVGQEPNAVAVFAMYAVDTNGVVHVHPKQRTVRIRGLFSHSSTNAVLADAISSLRAAVRELAVQEGLMK